MASMRARTASRGRVSPASIIPSIAAWIASAFIFMKSVRVLSRSKTMARTNRTLLLGGDSDPTPQADLSVVDAEIEAAGRIAAHPRFVRDGGAVASVVGERQQDPVVALAAFRKAQFHPDPLPLEADEFVPPLHSSLGEVRRAVSTDLAAHPRQAI